MPFPGCAWHLHPVSSNCFVLLQTLLTVTWQMVPCDLPLWLFIWLSLNSQVAYKNKHWFLLYLCWSWCGSLRHVRVVMRLAAPDGACMGTLILPHVSHPFPWSSRPAQAHPSLGHGRSMRAETQSHKEFSNFCLHHDKLGIRESQWSHPDSVGWAMNSSSCWEDMHSYVAKACP